MFKVSTLPTQEELLSLFYYKDGGLYWKVNKHRAKANTKAGGVCKTHGYVFIRLNKKLYREHRLIWKMFYNDEPKVLDHINRNRADNRIENLRSVTFSENCFNATTRADNTSGIRGVSLNRKTNKWRAYINFHKKRIELGFYDTLEAASAVVIEARNKYHKVNQ